MGVIWKVGVEVGVILKKSTLIKIDVLGCDGILI